jgi:hypothetical protein
VPGSTPVFWEKPISPCYKQCPTIYNYGVIEILSCLLKIFIKTGREEEANGGTD